jgi:ferredoxin
MKAVVDDEICCGHGACTAVCPSVFVITDDGYAEATCAEVPPHLEAAVLDAAQACPERAIHLT